MHGISNDKPLNGYHNDSNDDKCLVLSYNNLTATGDE